MILHSRKRLNVEKEINFKTCVRGARPHKHTSIRTVVRHIIYAHQWSVISDRDHIVFKHGKTWYINDKSNLIMGYVVWLT